jgi:hypothetical protein
MQEPQDKELNEEELDFIVGGVPPLWASQGQPDHEPGTHGGGRWHGKQDQEDLFEGTTDSGL